MYIVLGRFQPFHKGHAYLVEAALEKAVDKLQKDVERLKDKQRSFSNGE